MSTPKKTTATVIFIPPEGPMEEFETALYGQPDFYKTIKERMYPEKPDSSISSSLCPGLTELGYWLGMVSIPAAETLNLPFNPRATHLMREWRIYGPAVVCNERVVGFIDLSINELDKILALSNRALPVHACTEENLIAEFSLPEGAREAKCDQRLELLRLAPDVYPASDFSVRTCTLCYKQGDWKFCGKCKGPFYCSSKCQLLDWKNRHRKLCGRGLFEHREGWDESHD